MWHLAEIVRRNTEIADRYFADVPARTRLQARLLALDITSSAQNAAIMRAFDRADVTDREQVANLSVAELLALVKRAKTQRLPGTRTTSVTVP